MYTLVTGATGFIGKRLIKKLLEEGNRKIKCLVRENSDIGFLKKNNIEFVIGDVKDIESVEKAMKDVDVIYHLAARANPSNYRPYSYYQVNIMGTRNVCETARKQKGIRKIILMSSIAATGPSVDGNPLDEKSAYKPITNYGKSKVEVEKIAKKYYKDYKLPIVIIRPPMVYGIGDKDWSGFFKMIYIAGKNNKKLFVPGKHQNLFDFCYVDNLVCGMVLAEKSIDNAGEIYFISDERSYTIDEILKAVTKAYGIPMPTKFYSVRFMKKLAMLFDTLGKIFHFDGPISQREVNWMTKNYWICNCEKAKKELGYHNNISLEEGIRRTIDWLEGKKGDGTHIYQ